MKMILTLSFCVASFVVHSQITLKLYENIDYATNPENTNSDDVKSTLHFSRLSFGVQFQQKKPYFQEFELSFSQKAVPVVHVDHKSDNVDIDKYYLGIQYEVNRFVTNADNRLRFSLGGGTLLYYLFEKRTPENNDYYHHKHQYLGMTINLVPRLAYEISHKLIAEISGKIGLFDIRQDWNKIYSQKFPIRPYRVSDTETEFFPKAYTLRIGLGYRL
jgi:hypothetical protein